MRTVTLWQFNTHDRQGVGGLEKLDNSLYIPKQYINRRMEAKATQAPPPPSKLSSQKWVAGRPPCTVKDEKGNRKTQTSQSDEEDVMNETHFLMIVVTFIKC